MSIPQVVPPFRTVFVEARSWGTPETATALRLEHEKYDDGWAVSHDYASADEAWEALQVRGFSTLVLDPEESQATRWRAQRYAMSYSSVWDHGFAPWLSEDGVGTSLMALALSALPARSDLVRQTGLPDHKLTPQRGMGPWWVTSMECALGVERWHQWCERSGWEIEHELVQRHMGAMTWWHPWLDMLRRGATGRGLLVG